MMATWCVRKISMPHLSALTRPTSSRTGRAARPVPVPVLAAPADEQPYVLTVIFTSSMSQRPDFLKGRGIGWACPPGVDGPAPQRVVTGSKSGEQGGPVGLAQ